jgi:two-component system cell cycle response regulator
MTNEKTIIAEAGNLTIFNSPKRNRASLTRLHGDVFKRHPLDPVESTIGRATDCTVVIHEPSVSRKHARIVINGETTEVEDLGSSNGTFVNDQKVTAKLPIKHRDHVRFGNVLMRFNAYEDLETICEDEGWSRSVVDAGTQIFNKRYLVENLEAEIKFSRAAARSMAIIYFDLDHFKAVNDSLGHNAGDVILRETANVVKSVIRKDDIFGRFGGEEFVVILPNTQGKKATELAERIRVAVESHPYLVTVDSGQQKQHRQTVSLGVAELTPDIQSGAAFLELADQRLYQSKQTGRNKVTA